MPLCFQEACGTFVLKSNANILVTTKRGSGCRRRLVGAKIEQQQFSQANAVLQTFPQVNIDDQYFVQTQTINLSRLSTPGFSLTSNQEAILLNIAEVPGPESGYAQTLLSLLTGREFMPKLPDLGQERKGIESDKVSIAGFLLASPNPVDETLRVQIPVSFADQLGQRMLELYELASGRLIQTINMGQFAQVEMDVATIPTGIYLLTLKEQGIVIARQKIVVQH